MTVQPDQSPAPAQRPIDYPNEWPPGSGRCAPNDRQLVAHQLAPYVDELLYGGARGGGKTDWLLAECLRRCLAVDGLQAVFFRKRLKSLSGSSGAIPRLLRRIPKSVGTWHGTDRRWTFYNGSTLTLAFLEQEKDVQDWMGLELQFMAFDQVEQIDEDTYVMVRTSLRASGELAARMTAAGLRPASAASANPGGVGHVWVKRRFIDPFPTGGQVFRAAPTEREPTPMVRVFVPAKLEDNPALDVGDPTYRPKLEGLGDDERAAMLEGDWNVYKGARFSLFRTAVHVREPDTITLPPPGTSPRACGIDYGGTSPFVALWGAILHDDVVCVYREVWRAGLSASEQARLVLASEAAGERTDARPMPTALDPSCWAAPPEKPHARSGGQVVHSTGPPEGSIAWHYEMAGLPVVRADNRRREGAADVAGRLKVRADGWPRLIILSSCPRLIETLPALPRGVHDPEDVQKGPNDHWYDALRYLLGLLGFLSPIGYPDPPARRRAAHADAPATRTGSGLVIPGGATTRGLRKRGF